MAVSSKYTQDLSVQIVSFTFSCKWCLCFYFWAVIWSYIVDLFAGLHELASASSRTLLKLASSVRALLKPYGDIEDITCSRVDMNFIFEWSTRYLTSKRSERVRYRVDHEKITFISISGHVIFCLLYKHQ